MTYLASGLILAPMEGLLDPGLRALVASVGGLERCVSPFIRITDRLLPARSFTRVVPELQHGGLTASGVPVWPQLLGSDAACLADNAARLADLGPAGIDLNFGCPARTVNRHRGGAVLLDEPELLQRIASAVRRAVPASVVVSAKMRLGSADKGLMLACAQALTEGGAGELTVHARTRVQGYRPPVDWEAIAHIRQSLPRAVRIVANGDVFSVQAARHCRAVTGCTDLMLGRGMVASPGLARAIAQDQPDAPLREWTLPWAQVWPLLEALWADVRARVARRHQGGRLKQWLTYLCGTYPEAQQVFEALRLVREPEAISAWLARHGRLMQLQTPPPERSSPPPGLLPGSNEPAFAGA